MHTSTIIREIVVDAVVHRDPFPLLGMITFLIDEGYPIDRIKLFAERTLKLPEVVVIELLLDFQVVYLH